MKHMVPITKAPAKAQNGLRCMLKLPFAYIITQDQNEANNFMAGKGCE